jgi:hypothetical protein
MKIQMIFEQGQLTDLGGGPRCSSVYGFNDGCYHHEVEGPRKNRRALVEEEMGDRSVVEVLESD